MNFPSETATRPEPIPILAEGEGWLVACKPVGLSIHQSSYVGSTGDTLVAVLRRQLGRGPLHAVHRLDHATSGALLLARDPASAAALARQFALREVGKLYLAVVRGHPPDSMDIDSPLSGASPRNEPRPARTRLSTLARLSLPIALSRYPEARYGLLLATPESGRHHQIRRHLKHVAHPIVGDVKYGKGEHNRLFRQHFGIHRLLLHALSLRFADPRSGEDVLVRAPLDPSFRRAVDLFGLGEAELAAVTADLIAEG